MSWKHAVVLSTDSCVPDGCILHCNIREGAYVALVFAGMLVMAIGIPLMYMHYGACNINVLLISIALLSAIVLMVLSGRYRCCRLLMHSAEDIILLQS